MSIKTKRYLATSYDSYIKEIASINNIWYHGSDSEIKKFKFSKIGNSDKISTYHGYGIYFIKDIEKAKKYGDYITSVTIDVNSDILNEKVTKEQLSKVYNQLKEENLELNEYEEKFFKSPTYNKYSVLNSAMDFYDYLSRGKRFESIKHVSEFLNRSGIDGMRVINDVDDNILVVFNENIISINEYISENISENICNDYFDFEYLNSLVEFKNPIYSIINKRRTAKLLYISPKQYIYKIARNFGNLSYEDVAESSLVNYDKVDKYESDMLKGDKFPIPHYTKDGSGQEGRHRALACMKLKCETIPVIEFRHVGNEEVLEIVEYLKDKSEEEIKSYLKSSGFDNFSSLDKRELNNYIKYRL